MNSDPVDEYVEAELQRLLTEHRDIAEQGITVHARSEPASPAAVDKDSTVHARSEPASPAAVDKDSTVHARSEPASPAAEDKDFTVHARSELREQVLMLSGEVASAQRRDDILRLVQERFPEARLQVDIGLTRTLAPREAEELP
jgi:hypothetical protein